MQSRVLPVLEASNRRLKSRSKMQFPELLYKIALLAKFQAFNKIDLQHFSNKETNFLPLTYFRAEIYF